jgi:hypothetical protein
MSGLLPSPASRNCRGERRDVRRGCLIARSVGWSCCPSGLLVTGRRVESGMAARKLSERGARAFWFDRPSGVRIEVAE